MADKLVVRMALDRYDRHFPFFDGTATSSRLELHTLQVGQITPLRDGVERHGRMFRGHEFDIAEVSLSTYLIAVDKGMPFTAVPIFPRRLFSQSQMWVRSDSEIVHPQQLSGKKVLVNSFQTTLSLLAKGDLKFEYGVAWQGIRWFTIAREELPVGLKADVNIEPLPEGTDAGQSLARGEVDAVILPHPPHSITSGMVPARRLFPDTREEERRYFRKNGFFPIMHILAIRAELAAHNSWLPQELMETWRRSSEIAASYYEDPNWSMMLWARHEFEQERAELTVDPWPIGLRANRRNLERMIEYSFDQGLISRRIAPAELIFETVRDT
jgi:4,5-dihydroxyphthalate decarboxylase